MSDKGVQNRHDSTESVAHSVKINGEKVSGNIADKFSPLLREGETMPDVKLLMDLAVRYMQSQTKIMTDASDAHESELVDDIQPKSELEEIKAKIRELLMAIRSTSGSLYGKTGLDRLGLDGPTPYNVIELAALGQKVVKNLRDSKVLLPEKLIDSMDFDRTRIANELESHLQKIKEIRKVLKKEKREREATLNAKHQGIDTHDQTFGICARWLESTYDFGGEFESSSLLRPSSRRPGTLDSVSDVNQDSSEDTKDDDDKTGTTV